MIAANQIVTGDCIEVLKLVDSDTVDLLFADPPYNIGYQYDQYRDRVSRVEYRNWTNAWLTACVRVLRPGGTIWVAIGDEQAAQVKLLLDDQGLCWRNWCIWHYTFGPHCQRKFGRDHAHLLYYTKGEEGTFNADAIRVSSARQEKYGDKRADPRGRVPGDVWQFSRVCGTFKERTNHPCQMPEALLERVILSTSNPADLVLDPFSGSGTTCAVAKRLGRRWLGIELSSDYAVASRKRLRNVLPKQERA